MGMDCCSAARADFMARSGRSSIGTGLEGQQREASAGCMKDGERGNHLRLHKTCLIGRKERNHRGFYRSGAWFFKNFAG